MIKVASGILVKSSGSMGESRLARVMQSHMRAATKPGTIDPAGFGNVLAKRQYVRGRGADRLLSTVPSSLTRQGGAQAALQAPDIAPGVTVG